MGAGGERAKMASIYDGWSNGTRDSSPPRIREEETSYFPPSIFFYYGTCRAGGLAGEGGWTSFAVQWCNASIKRPSQRGETSMIVHGGIADSPLVVG